MAVNGSAVHGTRGVDAEVASPSGHAQDGSGAEGAWVRWTRSGDGSTLFAVLDGASGMRGTAPVGTTTVALRAGAVDLTGAELLDGTPVPATAVDDGVQFEVPPSASQVGPAVVSLPFRS
jgi:hypothetical protein